MEQDKFDSFNGTYVELDTKADESLRKAGFETRQQQAEFSLAMAAAVARAEQLHVTQVAAEQAMISAAEDQLDK